MHQLLRLDLLMGPAVAEYTDGTGCGYILIGPVVTGSTNRTMQLSLDPLMGPALQDPLRDQHW